MEEKPVSPFNAERQAREEILVPFLRIWYDAAGAAVV